MITAIGDVMKRCYERGWITTRDGNASLRRKGSNIIYITPSGVRKNVIRVEDLIKLKVFSTLGEEHLSIPNGTKPSGELHMHKLLQLSDNSKTRVVLHVHPTHVIAAMYAGWDLQELAKQFPELGRYTSVAPNIPVLPVTSEILGNVTYEHLVGMGYPPPPNGKMFDIVGQDRHGICAVAGDPWSAYEHVERLDHVCEIVLKSGIKP